METTTTMSKQRVQLSVDDSAVCGKPSSQRRRSTAVDVGWITRTRLLGAVLLVSILSFQVYEHVRLNKLEEQRQCAASAEQGIYDDDDDEVREAAASTTRCVPMPPCTRDDDDRG